MKNSLKLRILVLALISFVLLIFYWNYSLQRYLENPCNINFGGTACYNSEGTLIGVTLDTVGQGIATRFAQSSLNCSLTLTAVEIPSSPDTPIVTIVVPVSVARVGPGNTYESVHTYESVQYLHCGEHFPVISETNDEQEAWVLIRLNDTESGWVNIQDVTLNS